MLRQKPLKMLLAMVALEAACASLPPPPQVYLYSREPAKQDFIGVWVPDAVASKNPPRTIISPDSQMLSQKLICFDQAGFPLVQAYLEQLRIVAQKQCSSE